MRAVVQRVLSASVTVDGEMVSEISRGLMVLVGIGVDDNVSDIETLAKKILTLKAFARSAGEHEIQGEILCVSQFTLMANTSKGSKPDFHRAMVHISLFFYATRDPVPFTREKVSRSVTGHVRFVSAVHGSPIRSREN
ncbi:D-Tyr tRNAtyr deacylase-like domain-containing protein [Lactarius sanguifluus]|nr:D-Tyr tRNAtyr deacylase-like domain-containing protein [Lactarius sanguifluus]